MASNVSLNLTDSDLFSEEQISSEPSPQRNNSPNIINSTELSGMHTREMLTISSVTSPEPDIVSLEEDSNDPTIPYGFGVQQPIVPPTLIQLNLPPNPFNILATMAVVQADLTQRDKIYSPQSPEPSEPSPISTPPMTSVRLTAGKPRIPRQMITPSMRRMSPDGYTGIHPWTIPFIRRGTHRNLPLPRPYPPKPPRKLKRKLEVGRSFPEKGECSSMFAKPAEKGSPRRIFKARRLKTKSLHTLKRYIYMLKKSKDHLLHFKSYKRYADITYPSIYLSSCRSHVAYTCNSGGLIQIGTEQLRNKRIFIYFHWLYMLNNNSSRFVTKLCFYYINPTFRINLCSN